MAFAEWIQYYGLVNTALNADLIDHLKKKKASNLENRCLIIDKE